MAKEVSRFLTCLDFIYKMEGGFVNDPQDKGGMTFKGICRKYYPDLKVWETIDEFLPNKNLINSLVSTEIDDVYKKEYWDRCNCDLIEEPLDLIIFDTAVNMGVGRAKQFLRKTTDPDLYLYLRLDYYKEICKNNPSQNKFLKGWTNRILSLCKETGVKIDIDI